MVSNGAVNGREEHVPSSPKLRAKKRAPLEAPTAYMAEAVV